MKPPLTKSPLRPQTKSPLKITFRPPLHKGSNSKNAATTFTSPLWRCTVYLYGPDDPREKVRCFSCKNFVQHFYMHYHKTCVKKTALQLGKMEDSNQKMGDSNQQGVVAPNLLISCHCLSSVFVSITPLLCFVGCAGGNLRCSISATLANCCAFW